MRGSVLKRGCLFSMLLLLGTFPDPKSKALHATAGLLFWGLFQAKGPRLSPPTQRSQQDLLQAIPRGPGPYSQQRPSRNDGLEEGKFQAVEREDKPQFATPRVECGTVASCNVGCVTCIPSVTHYLWNSEKAAAACTNTRYGICLHGARTGCAAEAPS